VLFFFSGTVLEYLGAKAVKLTEVHEQNSMDRSEGFIRADIFNKLVTRLILSVILHFTLSACLSLSVSLCEGVYIHTTSSISISPSNQL